jgi:hypothetical protein
MNTDTGGWVDLNVHYGPDIVPRSQTAAAAVDAARRLGYAAVCVRAHGGSSVDLANALDRPGGPRVFGGITLNRPVGGLNPDAVAVALETGGRVVALPTWDAPTETRRPRPAAARVPLLVDGRPAAGLRDVLAETARHAAILDLGPVAAEQLLPLIELAREAGVGRIVVAHPFYRAQRYPDALVRDAARAGAIIEHCFMQFHPDYPDRPSIERLVEQIELVGPAAVVLTGDSGLVGFPGLAGCLPAFAELLAPRFSRAELRRMLALTPLRLLAPPEHPNPVTSPERKVA